MIDSTHLPIRLALVGIGKIARDQHLPAIAADPRFELVATASHDGRVEGVRGYDTIDQLLAAEAKVDAVAICTPPAGRSLVATAAIDAGLDVMIEKPPATTLSEMQLLEEKARSAGAVLFTAWHSREAAGVIPARDWLADKQVDHVRVIWREDIRRWHPGQDWILAAGGFGVFDPGINALSIVTAILPDPITVGSSLLTVPANREMPLAARLEMRSGPTTLEAEFDFLHQGRQQWEIVVDTDAGRLVLKDGGRVLVLDGAVTEGQDREYPRLYSRFAALIEQRQSDIEIAPLRLVADAFAMASRRRGPEFNW